MLFGGKYPMANRDLNFFFNFDEYMREKDVD